MSRHELVVTTRDGKTQVFDNYDAGRVEARHYEIVGSSHENLGKADTQQGREDIAARYCGGYRNVTDMHNRR